LANLLSLLTLSHIAGSVEKAKLRMLKDLSFLVCQQWFCFTNLNTAKLLGSIFVFLYTD
jgi:hypothetical protein